MFDTTFQEQLLKLKDKLDEIAGQNGVYECGEDFVGLAFSEHFIYYKTETFYSGCGTDHYSLEISWDEINKPIEYFREKFQKEVEERNKIEKEQEAKFKLHQEEMERAKLKELQDKYGAL